MPPRSEGRTRAARALPPGALGIALALVTAPARASDTEPIRIVFHAPAGCPDEAAFAGQVTARTQRARIVATGEEARTFTVTITSRGSKTRGLLTIDDPKGPPAAREVSGGTCDEVVSALGLITALAIDPRASTAPTPPAPPPPPPAPPPPKPREPLPPPPRYAALPWWGPVGEPLPALPEPAPEPRWRLAWGARLGGTSGPAPGVVLTAGAFVEVARSGGGVLSPAFRLGFFQGGGGFVDFGGGRWGRFALTAVRGEGCPVRLELLPVLVAYPCVFFDVGALGSSGVDRVAFPSSTRPWAAPGATARLQWELLGRLRLEAEGGVNFPLVRDTFSFQDPSGVSQTVRAVPAAGGFFASGVGTHFP